jgi:hypothetical protein
MPENRGVNFSAEPTFQEAQSWDRLSGMRGHWRRPLHFAAHTVAFYHLWGAIMSGIGWLIATFGELDRSWKVGSALAFAYCAAIAIIAVGRQWWVAWRRESDYLPLRILFEWSRYTDAGLSWWLVDQKIVDDRAEVTLRITPTGHGEELPQPLKLLVISAAIQEVLSVKHYPTETDDVIIYPVGKKWQSLELCTPRLQPPDHLDIRLRSKGTSLPIAGVKRNPK